jgi:hypothetical protein
MAARLFSVFFSFVVIALAADLFRDDFSRLPVGPASIGRTLAA